MFDGIGVIVEYIRMIFDFIMNIIESLISAIGVLSASVQTLILMLGYLPSFLGASVTIVLTVVILNYLIGRSNQS